MLKTLLFIHYAMMPKIDHTIKLLGPIYEYFDTQIAFLKGSGSGSVRTIVRFVPKLKAPVQVQVHVWA